MKLEQGQVWKKGDVFLRVVERTTISVVYKSMIDLTTREGPKHQATKKEFCRMLKGAVLLSPDQIPAKIVPLEPDEV